MLPDEEEFPTTPAEVYDLLQREFGIGSYDDVVSQEAWFKARMKEIGMVKRLMKARRATERQVAIAAWYAKEAGVVVRTTHRLFPLIPEAMREYNRRVAEQGRQAAADKVATAVQEAVAAGQLDWADRLMRAQDSEQVLREWASQGRS